MHLAIYHLGNDNWRGAVILLGEGISRLSRYLPDYAGLDINELLTDSQELLKLRKVGFRHQHNQ